MIKTMLTFIWVLCLVGGIFSGSSCHRKQEGNNCEGYRSSLVAWLSLEKHSLTAEPVDTIVCFAPAVLGSCQPEADGQISLTWGNWERNKIGEVGKVSGRVTGMRLNVFPIILQERGEIKDLWMFMGETFACLLRM